MASACAIIFRLPAAATLSRWFISVATSRPSTRCMRTSGAEKSAAGPARMQPGAQRQGHRYRGSGRSGAQALATHRGDRDHSCAHGARWLIRPSWPAPDDAGTARHERGARCDQATAWLPRISSVRQFRRLDADRRVAGARGGYRLRGAGFRAAGVADEREAGRHTRAGTIRSGENDPRDPSEQFSAGSSCSPIRRTKWCQAQNQTNSSSVSGRRAARSSNSSWHRRARRIMA